MPIEGLTIERLYDLYVNQGLSSCVIAPLFGCKAQTIRRYLRKHNIPVRSSSEAHKLALQTGNRWPPRGDRNPNWKGGRKKHGDYIVIYQPGHPRTYTKGYVPEHILVWEQVHNRPLPPEWVVHHLNGIKSDNRPENLAGLPSKKHVHILAVKAKRIRELEVKNRQLKHALEEGQMLFIFEN